MIDVKQAVTVAYKQFNDLFANAGYREITLEEVELSDNDAYWLVTFSYYPFADESLKSFLNKSYKTVKVDAENGAARSVKIRVLA